MNLQCLDELRASKGLGKRPFQLILLPCELLLFAVQGEERGVKGGKELIRQFLALRPLFKEGRQLRTAAVENVLPREGCREIFAIPGGFEDFQTAGIGIIRSRFTDLQGAKALRCAAARIPERLYCLHKSLTHAGGIVRPAVVPQRRIRQSPQLCIGCDNAPDGLDCGGVVGRGDISGEILRQAHSPQIWLESVVFRHGVIEGHPDGLHGMEGLHDAVELHPAPAEILGGGQVCRGGLHTSDLQGGV